MALTHLLHGSLQLVVFVLGPRPLAQFGVEDLLPSVCGLGVRPARQELGHLFPRPTLVLLDGLAEDLIFFWRPRNLVRLVLGALSHHRLAVDLVGS